MSPRPKSDKKKYLIAIQPEVMKGLKHLAVEHEKPVGEIIEGLWNFFNDKKGMFQAHNVTNENKERVFRQVAEVYMRTAGLKTTTWEGEPDIGDQRAKQREELADELKDTE